MLVQLEQALMGAILRPLYVSSYCLVSYICVLILLYVSACYCNSNGGAHELDAAVLRPLYMCPHIAICVPILVQLEQALMNSMRLYCGPYICVLILLYTCRRTAIYVSSCCYICVSLYCYAGVSSYCYICIHTLLYTCCRTTIYVSSYCYICVSS